MPNWCENSLTLTGPVEMIDRAVKAAGEGRMFDEFVPLVGPWEHSKAVALWGTKWDVGEDNYYNIERLGADTARFSFNSAWSPPMNFYHALQGMGITVDAMYHESGMAFYGYFNDEVGDQCLEYTSFDELPDDIVKEFGLEDWSEEE